MQERPPFCVATYPECLSSLLQGNKSVFIEERNNHAEIRRLLPISNQVRNEKSSFFYTPNESLVDWLKG